MIEAAVLLIASHVTANPSTMRLAEPLATADPVSNFLQYGVLGLVVIGFATGWIVPGPTAKALAAENTRLSALFEGQLLPMVGQYASTMERAAIALEKSAEAMDRQARREQDAHDRATREQTLYERGERERSERDRL